MSVKVVPSIILQTRCEPLNPVPNTRIPAEIHPVEFTTSVVLQLLTYSAKL